MIPISAQTAECAVLRPQDAAALAGLASPAGELQLVGAGQSVHSGARFSLPFASLPRGTLLPFRSTTIQQPLDNFCERRAVASLEVTLDQLRAKMGEKLLGWKTATSSSEAYKDGEVLSETLPLPCVFHCPRG